MKQFASFLFFLLLILFPKICVEGARQGLILWGLTLVPTLLPFFIATKSILQWNIPKKLLFPYLLFVGYFCGYPTGASVINQLYQANIFHKKQSELLICFCNHTSPAFLISFVYYTYLKPNHSIIFFLLPIYFAAFFWCLIFYLGFHCPSLSPKASEHTANTFTQQSLEEIFLDSVVTIIKIGCFMIIFSILIQISFHLTSNISENGSLIACFLEVTTGVNHIATSSLPPQLKIALIGALCSFGGYCSIAQVQSVLSKELTITPYIFFKICTGATTFFLLYLAA
ncbi:MAG: hypothetical protein Q4D45_04860 [Lachnospiraceae bacterium]|nr:hypothetical protein [Lachnospiraceae bacterium]